MPAINVARTDTFEQQRIKINELASDLFEITGGGGGATISPSAVSIQDGTRSTPSLAFQSDSTLGAYKNDAKTMAFVSNSSLAFTFSDAGTYFENSFYARKNFLTTSGLSVTETGSEYDVGVTADVTLFGGSGQGAKATVTVVPFSGSVTENNNVDEYETGVYESIPVTTDNIGTNALMNFTIVTTEVATKGIVDQAGTGYYPGIYNNVELTGGTGSGKFANITVEGSIDFTQSITGPGSGYTEGTYEGVQVDNVPTTTATLTVANREKLEVVPGRKYEWNVADDGGTNLDYVFTGQNAISASGNDISISVSKGSIITINVNSPGHPFWIQTGSTGYDANTVLVEEDGVTNNGTENGTIVWDTEEYFEGTIYYVCQNHSAMGGTIELIANPFTEFSPGETITGPNGSGTISSYNDINGTMFFASITGSISVNDEITNGTGAFGIVKATDNVFQYLINGSDINQDSPTFNAGDTIRFDTSDSSNAGYVLELADGFGFSFNPSQARTVSYGTPGSAGSFTDLSLNITATDSGISGISFLPLEGLYGEIAVAGLLPGGTGSHIFDMTADVTVDANGIVTDFTVVSEGSNWKAGDDVTVHPSRIGGTGSGFEVEFSAVTVTGTVTSVTETLAGNGYVEDDILSFSNTATRGYGSGFQYRISNRRDITDISFENYGADYALGDKLFLPFDAAYGGDNGFEFEITRIGAVNSIEITDGGKNYYPGDILQVDREALVANTGALTEAAVNAQIAVNDIDSTVPITIDNTGAISVTGSVTSTTSTADIITGNTSVSTPLSVADTLQTDLIQPKDTASYKLDAALGNITIDAVNVLYNTQANGTTVTIVPLTGNITTTGVLKTTSELNVNNVLSIVDNTFTVSGGNDLILSPSANKVVEIDSTAAIKIAVGNTSARPPVGFAEDGHIRFNTDSQQYEGYSANTNSWSSLGGVRDLDGNTYILAEETVGNNDNTLWFYNDGDNTVRFSPFYQEFVEVKKVRSVNTTAPAYVDWTASTPVTAGDYLKSGHNIYEVVTGGTTGATADAPPTGSNPDTNPFTNGTATLQFSASAVADLTYEEINELKIGPDIDVPVVIGGDLRLVSNVISTDISDIELKPNTGKKVVINANTSLAIPTGSTAERGIPAIGSIRFNTTLQTYEGYIGTNKWGSLGGIKDVDQNTYIIPETAPGANENILYFYNDGNNTVNLTTANLEMRGVDSISSPVSNTLEFTAETILFNNATTTLDNTSTTSTFLHTSKQYFDLGLSSGLNTDPVLRLDDQGDVYFNIGFGTGTFSGVKVFDGELKDFELADYQIVTSVIELDKGTIDTGATDVYSTSTAMGSKVTVFVENISTGEREFVEYGIIDNGTDVFHTEYGNVQSNNALIATTIELTGTNTVRLNVTLTDNVATGNDVKIKVISQLTKK